MNKKMSELRIEQLNPGWEAGVARRHGGKSPVLPLNALPRPSRQTGLIAVVVALGAVGLVGMIGMALDVSRYYLEQTKAQSAADAAALSAAQVRRTGTINDALAAATASATQNGFTSSVSNGTNVLSAIPPGGSNSAYSGNDQVARVTITKPVAFIFLPSIGISSRGVTVTAVAGPANTAQSCALTTGPSGTTGLLIQGAQAGILQDPDTLPCSNRCDLNINSNVTVKKDTVGVNMNVLGSCTPATTCGSTCTTKSTATAAVDPYQGKLLTPPLSTCPPGNTQVSISTDRILPSGTYCGNGSSPAINITGGTTTLNGLYVLNGGGIRVKGATLNGSNVTIYNSGNPALNSPNRPGSLSLLSGVAVNLTSPTVGDWVGLNYVQPNDNVNDITFSSNSDFYINGNFYAPAANLLGTGGGAIWIGSIIVKSIALTGNSKIHIKNTYKSLAAYSGLPVLYE
jgi:Flp pilus assembly protein TadG